MPDGPDMSTSTSKPDSTAEPDTSSFEPDMRTSTSEPETSNDPVSSSDSDSTNPEAGGEEPSLQSTDTDGMTTSTSSTSTGASLRRFPCISCLSKFLSFEL